MPTDWDRIIEGFTARHTLEPAATAALRRFVDEHILGAMITVDPSTSSTILDAHRLGMTVLPVLDDGDAVTEPQELLSSATRYVNLGSIGVGGMGEVRRVRDLALHRTMAMKLLRQDLVGHAAAEARFIAEAQATAQLQHPGVVPVHDIGRLPDGRWYFTMKELRGHTLHDLLHGPAEERPSLRRRLELLRAASEAVAYSHSRGAVHRDLKPANILIGDYGEVVVLDWGLVKAVGSPDLDDAEPAMAVDSFATRAGTVLGTPAYMSPEQAAGDHDVGPAADIYALGAVLYELLAGRPPFLGEVQEVLAQVRAAQPPPLPPDMPPELVQLCQAAMQRAPGARPASVRAWIDRLTHYLDGAARRDRALDILRRADALQPRVEGLLDQAEAARRRARALAENTPPWAPVDDKRSWWAEEDAAADAQREADLVGLDRLQLLRVALTEAPELPEARSRLAYVYHWCHVRAERLGRDQELRQYEHLLREYDDGRYAAYLAGRGRLTLYTEPRATARLFRLELVDRRWTPEWTRDLGETPLLDLDLPMGRWLIRLEASGHAPALVPIGLGREEHWTHTPPGERHPAPIRLLREADLGPHEVYVPAGWALLGGDPDAELPPTRCWVDGFIVQRFPVSNQQYIDFLDALVLDGRSAEAASRVPRTGGGTPVFWQDEHGRHHLGVDDDGDHWMPDHPVVCLQLSDARAYAAWWSSKRHQPWRLPWSDEWEKAARGVDGRRYPMGPHLDPTWANIRGCSPRMLEIASTYSYPEDVSIYGVRGLAGGVLDLCQDAWEGDQVAVHAARAIRKPAHEGTFLVGRGGWRTAEVERCSTYRQQRLAPEARLDMVGFRLARSVAPVQHSRDVAFRLTLAKP